MPLPLGRAPLPAFVQGNISVDKRKTLRSPPAPHLRPACCLLPSCTVPLQWQRWGARRCLCLCRSTRVGKKASTEWSLRVRGSHCTCTVNCFLLWVPLRVACPMARGAAPSFEGGSPHCKGSVQHPPTVSPRAAASCWRRRRPHRRPAPARRLRAAGGPHPPQLPAPACCGAYDHRHARWVEGLARCKESVAGKAACLVGGQQAQ